MIPKEVFHYTKSSTLRKIIDGQQLKMGRLKFTNDPKEAKEHLFDSFVSSSDLQWETSKVYEKLCEAARLIKLNEWKVLCFSKNQLDLDAENVSRHQNPFLSGSFRPRMWATYAENHTGVCLKFDGEKLDTEIKKKELEKRCQVFCGDIEYDDQILIGAPDLDVNVDEVLSLSDTPLKNWLRTYFKKRYKAMFLRKSRDWETEYEFRWLIHGEEDNDEYISIGHALEQVILGADFPDKEYPTLFKFCNDLNVPIYKIVWNNGVPDKKRLSAIPYQEQSSSKSNYEIHNSSLVYFECTSMRELYNAMKKWEDENQKSFLSVNIQQDNGNSFCCIASVTPKDTKQSVITTEYKDAMTRFQRKAIRIIEKERKVGTTIEFVDSIIPYQKVLAIQKRLMECTNGWEIRKVFEEEY